MAPLRRGGGLRPRRDPDPRKGPGALHVGTCGWSYPEWRGVFYPQGLRQADFLKHYVERFGTVEIDNTFYRLPRPAAVAAWRAAAPPGFLFALKAHRFITHMKKLKEPAEGLGNFLPLVEPLGERLGPILFQLPPRWARDDARLEGLLEALPPGRRFAVEFRDDSWLAPPVTALLERHGVAFCQSDIPKPPADIVTAGFVMLRLHGPTRPSPTGAPTASAGSPAGPSASGAGAPPGMRSSATSTTPCRATPRTTRCA